MTAAPERRPIRAISLGYHDVSCTQGRVNEDPRPAAAAYAVSLERFREHLTAIDGAAGRAVSTTAQASAWRGDGNPPVLLTFDDGAECAYTCIADALEQHGWRGIFFVTTSWIGRTGFMNPAQIRELHRRGHVIGSHTVSHPRRMSELPGDALIREWTGSREALEDILGEGVDTASVADGYYSRRVGQSAEASGIRILMNSEPVTGGHWEGSCLVLGRYAIQATTTAAGAAAIAGGRIAPRLRQLALWRAKGVVKAVAGERYLALRARLLSRGPA
jgi:peptidoglycan/xylan/chitin deacetylase (PgdA/CDA1 family)